MCWRGNRIWSPPHHPWPPLRGRGGRCAGVADDDWWSPSLITHHPGRQEGGKRFHCPPRPHITNYFIIMEMAGVLSVSLIDVTLLLLEEMGIQRLSFSPKRLPLMCGWRWKAWSWSLLIMNFVCVCVQVIQLGEGSCLGFIDCLHCWKEEKRRDRHILFLGKSGKKCKTKKGRTRLHSPNQ